MNRWKIGAIRSAMAAAIAITGLLGCQGSDRDAGALVATGPEGLDPAGMGQKALEEVDPVTGESTIRDPLTGNRYLLNPNRTLILPGEGSLPLSKAAAQTNSQVDASGRIETRWYQCSSARPLAVQAGITCQVDPGFILIGGGAYVDYGTGPGALLTESSPLDNSLVTWVASSKQHLRTNAHTLYAYAIGMRLRKDDGSYMPVNSMLNHVQASHGYSAGNVAYPTVTLKAPAGWSTLGGGVRAVTSGGGQLLTRSIQDPAGNGWAGQSKDQSQSSPGSILVFGIFATKAYIPEFGYLWADKWGSTNSTFSKQRGVTKVSAPQGWVLSCPGGNANADFTNPPPSRLLYGLRPEFQTQGQAIAAAYDKDHVTAGGGRLRAEANLLIRSTTPQP